MKNFEEFINEKEEVKKTITEKVIGKITVDSGMFVITDPSYVAGKDIMKTIEENKYKPGNYDFAKGEKKKKDTWGSGVLVSGKTGGDGAWEVVGRYDSSLEWPHLPFEIIIRLRTEETEKEK